MVSHDLGADDRVRRFMAEGAEIEGVRLRVVELTGRPGEAVVMHPWLMHAAAPNCRDAARVMLSQTVVPRPALL